MKRIPKSVLLQGIILAQAGILIFVVLYFEYKTDDAFAWFYRNPENYSLGSFMRDVARCLGYMLAGARPLFFAPIAWWWLAQQKKMLTASQKS